MSYRLCSDHFDDKCYTSTERRRLSNFALPEIFTHNSGSLETGNIDTQLEHDISEEQGEISADLLCRICACTSEDLVPVFGERGLEMQLLDKIHTHLPIMVTADDLLPITVCMDCVYKLEMCHEFVHSCLEADTKLREFLGFSADNEEYTEEYGETQSSLEIKEESDDDQDTGMFDDSCDNQDGGGYMEHTDVMEISQDELHSVDSYVQEEYVIEDSADAQLEDEAIADHMQEESAHLRSEQCENDRSQSAETEKPKFKVVVVKMKNTPDMTQDDQIEKALGVLKNVQDTSHSVTEYLLTEHMRVHSDERPYSCTQCGKCFHKRSQLSQHMVIHADARQHICSVCGKIFNRLGNMKMHAKTHEDSNKSMCKICKRTFNSMGELISHRRTHTKEEIEEAMKQPENQGAEPLVFVCDVCGKQLASKLTLKYHMMIHAGDKPFRCEICDKRFALKTKLQLHERIHSSKKPFQCSFCTEGFQTKQYKIIHERIHTGERPYKCMQCTKAFRSRMLLNQHMLVHSDLRPFKCSLCDKSFRRRDTLDTHMRIHTGERPYSCNICGRGFKQKGDCNKHQRTHFKGRKTAVQILDSAGSVIFSCALCGAHFDLKEELDAHFEAYHSSDVVVSSNTMIINTENLVPVTEIAQDEKPIVLTDYGQECDAS
ncbi:hypothetical protein B7P43_G09812 [Cryptotermes secundus]|nr:hypothetical protein B7P43_G09812 [Cryptotermes secundus]